MYCIAFKWSLLNSFYSTFTGVTAAPYPQKNNFKLYLWIDNKLHNCSHYTNNVKYAIHLPNENVLSRRKSYQKTFLCCFQEDRTMYFDIQFEGLESQMYLQVIFQNKCQLSLKTMAYNPLKKLEKMFDVRQNRSTIWPSFKSSKSKLSALMLLGLGINNVTNTKIKSCKATTDCTHHK